jgi:hypothetical protein
MHGMTEPTTKDIRDLVLKVLDSGLTRTEHVIDDVLHAIEQSPQWLSEYEGLRERFKGRDGKDGKKLVNQMVGRWTSSVLGWPARERGAQVPSRLNKLSETYSVLVPSNRKLTSEERRLAAGNEVLEFFKEHREALDRDALISLKGELQARVLQGEPVEEAFFAVMTDHGLDVGPLQAAVANRAA